MAHTGAIILVKAASRREAVKNAKQFLHRFGRGRVYDYYSLGGYWSGLLTGYEPRDNPLNQETCSHCHGTGKDASQEERACYKCNGTGKSLKWRWVPYKGDVMPLSEVKDRVLVYLGDWRNKYLKVANQGIAECEQKADDWLLPHYLILKGRVLWDQFIWESAVYNAEEESNSVPSCPDGYWAVVVDLHS